MGSNKWVRNTFVWGLLVLAAVFIWFTFIGSKSTPGQVDASKLAQDIKSGNVTRIVTASQSNDIEIYYANNPKEPSLARLPPNTNILDLLEAYGINLSTQQNLKLETKAGSQ